MTPYDLLPVIREDFLDDTDGTNPRWGTSFLLRSLGDAQREACRRQDLRHLYDATTAAICTIPVIAGTRGYAIDPRVLRIERASLSDGCALGHTIPIALDAQRRYWREDTGTPRQFVIMGRTLILDRTPTAADTLSLAVWREPLAHPEISDALEWPGDCRKLCHWVAAQAFLRPDEDSFRDGLAKVQMSLFDQEFGAPVSARALAELLQLPGVVSLGGFAQPHWRHYGEHC